MRIEFEDWGGRESSSICWKPPKLELTASGIRQMASPFRSNSQQLVLFYYLLFKRIVRPSQEVSPICPCSKNKGQGLVRANGTVDSDDRIDRNGDTDECCGLLFLGL